MECKTVRVVAPAPEEQGPYIIINETDFDASKHQVYEEPAAAAERLAEAPAVAAKKGAR